MRRDVFVYISGPMTAGDGRTVEQNVADGVRVFLDLLHLGIPAFCPHLCGAFPSAWRDLSHDQWLIYDSAVIDRCTHVLMMPRWETSTGARAERLYAAAKGIPVLDTMDALIASLLEA